MTKRKQHLLECAVAMAVAASPAGVHASGFQLMEQNASGLGNAYAGQAAAAEDASTIYFNPAGLTRLPGGQAVQAIHIISPSAKFRDAASVGAAGGVARGGSAGDAGDLALIPSLYLSWQFTPNVFAGIGISTPFGLKTNYEPDWVGRFHALKSEARSINVNPAVAIKISDTLSVGVGVSYQHFEAELTKAVNYTALGAGIGIPVAAGTEGTNKIEGDDRSWGANIGVLFKAGPNTDIGVAYRSPVMHTLKGDVIFYNRPAALGGAAAFNSAGDGPIKARLKLPASASLAIKHRINPGWMGRGGWEFLADLTWTQWSGIHSLDIIRSNEFQLESTPFQWRDTWRMGVGVNYHASQPWTYRFGVAYDQTPTSTQYRTPRIPDQDRKWVALGAQYRISKTGAIDVGYAHLFFKDANMNLSGPPALTAAQAAGRGSLVGNYDGEVDIVSVQYRHLF